jgi:phospholipid/cholesterol/gamma-HCH transport system permease protein
MGRSADNPLKDAFASLGRVTVLFLDTMRSIFAKRFRGRDLMEQLHFIGVKSQSVVLLTGAFTGMVMCAQFYIQFHKVKMDSAVMSVVTVAMARELGAVLTSLMIAGRVGAAMAAQLGTMKVTEQIDALRTLATSPVDYLVAPRLLAMLISLPLLTAEAIAISMVSGMLVAVYLLGLDPVFLWSNMVFYTGAVDVWMGLIKAFIFAGIIATVACHKGMHCGQGAEGVGKATTEAVVAASISILVSNFFVTLVLNNLLIYQE